VRKITDKSCPPAANMEQFGYALVVRSDGKIKPMITLTLD